MIEDEKKHVVKANFQVFDLSKAGTSLELEIFEQQPRASRRKIGTVIIGRGSLTWVKGGAHTGKRIPWSRFAEVMEWGIVR